MAAPNGKVNVTAFPRILVVDNDPVMLDLLDIVFSNHIPESSIAVTHCANLAIELMAGSEFDVLVTEINMPGMSGFDLIERVRKCKPEFPIVVHSSESKERMHFLASNIHVVEKGASGVDLLVRAVLAATEECDALMTLNR